MSDFDPLHQAPDAEAAQSTELATSVDRFDRTAKIVGSSLLIGGLGLLHIADLLAATAAIKTYGNPYGNLGPKEVSIVVLSTILVTTDVVAAHSMYRLLNTLPSQPTHDRQATTPQSEDYDAAYIVANPPYTRGAPVSTDHWLYQAEPTP